MRHRHGRRAKSPSLFHFLTPRPHRTSQLVRDVALGAFIAKEIIKK